jgi:hypothetical protein
VFRLLVIPVASYCAAVVFFSVSLAFGPVSGFEQTVVVNMISGELFGDAKS